MRKSATALAALCLVTSLPAFAAPAKRMSPDQARAWCNQRFPDPANMGGPGMSSRGGSRMQSVRDNCVARLSGA